MTKYKKRMPWEAPEIGGASSKEIEEERNKDNAFGATIEGGCWFSHVGGIDEMEKSYGRRGREDDISREIDEVLEP